MEVDARHRRKQGNHKTNGIVLGIEPNRFSWYGRRKFIVYVGVGLVIIIALGVTLWWRADARHAHNNAVANAAEEANLQKALAFDLSTNDEQSVAYDTTQLINGKQDGTFTFNNKLLAEYYMQAGAAYTNLQEYQKAIADFKSAPKYDGTEMQAALEGEVSAGYAAGERQQLIPLLQQLEKLTKNSHDIMSPPAAQYQDDVTAIQHNQKVDL